MKFKLAKFGLSTQGNKETLREHLASFLDAEETKTMIFLAKIRQMKLK